MLFVGTRFFCKQKTAYEMRISDWSSDVCSSDLLLNEVDIYAAPPAAGSELKFGCGQHRRPGDPDNLDPLAPDEAAAVASAFAPLLRDFADYKVLRGKLFPYAVSPDERFVTERNGRSEEHTSELQSLMRLSHVVFRLK